MRKAIRIDADREMSLSTPVFGLRPLDPTQPRRGRYNPRWKIQENLPGQAGAR